CGHPSRRPFSFSPLPGLVPMLTPGNSKLGRQRRIWSFSLPSRHTCPGQSPACSGPCYSAHLESWRPDVRRRYRRNLALSRRPDFAHRVCAFLTSRHVAIVRLHVGGAFFSARYARQCLSIMRHLPQTRFYLYSRSWRIPAIRRVLRQMAQLEHVQVWFSCDRDTGVPTRVPHRVRLAWLMTGPDDVPPRAHLIFRTRRLRSVVQKFLLAADHRKILVCPTENGVTRTTCGLCGVCWNPPSFPGDRRLSLPVVSGPLDTDAGQPSPSPLV